MKTEWQPIETAPKDGTSILVYTANGYVEIGNWEDERFARNPKPYWRNTGPWGKTWMRNNPPKFWMPLPEPPKP